MTWIRRVRPGLALAGVAVTLGTLVVVASPASAAVPRCDRAESFWTGVWGDTYVYMPSSGSAAFNCYMNRGEIGNEVRALQDSLNKCYGASLSVDGEFGPKTQTALRAAEASHGMTSGLGRYDDHDAWNFRFWGWYLDNNGNPRWRCSRMDGPILG